MKIWWCQEHECSGEDVSCVYSHWNEAEGRMANMPPCRMVPMRLIPDNAETERRVAVEVASWTSLSFDGIREARAILAALDGETP